MHGGVGQISSRISRRKRSEHRLGAVRHTARALGDVNHQVEVRVLLDVRQEHRQLAVPGPVVHDNPGMLSVLAALTAAGSPGEAPR